MNKYNIYSIIFSLSIGMTVGFIDYNLGLITSMLLYLFCTFYFKLYKNIDNEKLLSKDFKFTR